MIRFTLKCDQDHRFDSWFKSADAFDALSRARHVSCPECGSVEIGKALMAPRIAADRTDAPDAPNASDRSDRSGRSGPSDRSDPAERSDPRGRSAPQTAKPDLSTPRTEAEKALHALRRKVEQSADYVGGDFVSQARAMHAGETPERAIYGEARLDQARKLAEDGVPVMPLPFRPKRSTH